MPTILRLPMIIPRVFHQERDEGQDNREHATHFNNRRLISRAGVRRILPQALACFQRPFLATYVIPAQAGIQTYGLFRVARVAKKRG